MKIAIVLDVEKKLKRWRKYWLVLGLLRIVSKPTLVYENIFSDNIQEVIKVAIGLKKKLRATRKIIDDKG